ncbi:hypothetical protein ABVT39_001801 [Epinephelus coioides]
MNPTLASVPFFRHTETSSIIIWQVRDENDLLNKVALILDDAKQLLIAILLHLDPVEQCERPGDFRQSAEVKCCKPH